MEIRTRTEQRKKSRPLRQLIRLWLFSMVSKLVVTAILLGYVYQLGAPSLSVPETTVIYSADGEVIGEQHEGQNRHWIPLEEMGDNILLATVAIEDRKFYDHHGFDMLRIARAAMTNVTAGSKLQGASTITQQYARNLYLTHDKTWVRKLNEAMYALRLEMHYTKEEILEGYLNTIYYGHGAYGIEAAANFYFGKPASELSVAEAAMLAGIPKGPGLYSPHNNPTQASGRQAIVLKAMLDTESITQAEYARASGEVVKPEAFSDFQGKRTAPYFQDAVQTFLEEELEMDAAAIHSSGLEIHTTLDQEQQRLAEDWIEKEMAGPYDLQVAFVAMDPRTGYVKAMVGGRDYQESSFNRATQARRQAGSTMKPLLYYAALEEGFRPNTQFKIEATDFVYDYGRKTYSPKNFNDRYAEDNVTMMQALAVSDNIYAMKTHFLLGFDTLVNTVKRFGIESPVSPVPSLALGAADVSVIEMTNAYSPFANGGYGVKPTLVTRVVDRNGNELYRAENEPSRVIDPAYAFLMTDMMHGMFEMGLNDPRSGTAVTGRSLIHLLNRPIAGKSGSTTHDSWMIGYTPQLLTGVWIGNDKQLSNLPSSNEWGLYSKRIWAQFMREALEDELILPFEQPPNVVGVDINPLNGKLATDACPIQRTSYFLQGTEPTEYCTDHKEGREPGKKAAEPDEEPSSFIDRFFKWFD
ncbi:PBP1A family penicillin-binding protein [Bacillus sp. H-16]|uniref:transglycosylase domain-containing protein n=1 Tax=Alteribacter salitolerans TaxID=2912333 RepID=UPI001962FE01|nr:PBP1A family penicillin-binding protein [Alteribacter salitolerans]MBM7095537.1 PBP1A family penicillin-binding protein [Alteribacter salitolerans]